MSPLTPATTQTGLPQPAYTTSQINRELQRWTGNLAQARADGDILAVDTALRFIDTWLDRKLALQHQP